MVVTIPAGASILEIANFKIRLRELLALFLIWSVLLNIFLVSRLQTVESGHSLHSIHNNAQSSTTLSSRNRDTPKKQQPTTKKVDDNDHDDDVLLRCESFGGPSSKAAIADIVYWKKDPPVHKQFHSIYANKQNEDEKFFIYEPDDAGFSNVRITFETVVALAKATGRTLVLSPKMIFHQLYFDHPEGWRSYSYTDFFDISNIPTISMENYLKRVAMSGQLRNTTGEVSFPPSNRTNWDAGKSNIIEALSLFTWLSESMVSIDWNRDACIIPFPSKSDTGTASMNKAMGNILNDTNDTDYLREQSYAGKPIPANSLMKDRLREMIANRKKFCYYNQTYQDAPSIYMDGHEKTGIRPLIQFFAYMFFENWEHELQMKRFIRDHLRFSDIIQCAAARIVNAIREIAKNSGDGNNIDGSFDTMHIRRGDFKGLAFYKDGIVDPNDIVASKYFEPQRTVYIATDESDIAFFEPLRQQHTVLFLNDFRHLIADMDPNYYGMIEQLVCAKGDKFVGTYYSTFSAYINRVRGYHAQKALSSKAIHGYLNSEYMGHNGNFRNVMKVSLLFVKLPVYRLYLLLTPLVHSRI